MTIKSACHISCEKEYAMQRWAQFSSLILRSRMCMPPPVISCWRHSVFGLSMSPCVRAWSYINSLWTRYLIHRFSEFRQIYSSRAVGDKDELVRFRSKKVKGQGHRHHYPKMHFSGWGTGAYRLTVRRPRPSSFDLLPVSDLIIESLLSRFILFLICCDTIRYVAVI